jgi:hypothetical protein
MCEYGQYMGKLLLKEDKVLPSIVWDVGHAKPRGEGSILHSPDEMTRPEVPHHKR